MNELSWLEAIEQVLRVSEGAMHYRDIANQILTEGLRENVGATPASTVNTNLNLSIKREGESSPFRRTNRGEYILKTENLKDLGSTSNSTKIPVQDKDAEDQYEIISSFGMFWQRDAVLWQTQPSIFGMQQIGAQPVDFKGQVGIYLLYDGREVIYVGRATERPIGRRLYEHTLDRLATRWDRFSWFGLLPVDENGALASLPKTFDSANLIPALEAVLIEALEPRQNRKRGDDLTAVEYLQKENPELERQRKKDILRSALEKI